MILSEAVVHPLLSYQRQASELLYRSGRTVVSRLRHASDRTSTIRKELLGPDAQARMSHEARMLERLVGLRGVPQLLATGPGASLLLRDSFGVPLAGTAPLDPASLLELARRLARIVAAVHRRGVLHLDIAPANILHGGTDGGPELIDFHLASLATEERRGFTHHRDIAGTLAYIAPELTGRVGHGIDHRADLYQLGATLYELATGAPPFGHGDALQLIRDHIATVPAPPQRRVPDLPPMLSDIILRLLEKEPARRYQSAEGLGDDLDRLHAALSRGEPAPGGLGASDFPVRLVAPSRLIGRQAELDALQSAFADALDGRCRSVLISGPAGVGKTALIDQLRPIVTGRSGWFVVGKFDPYRTDGTPAGVPRALRDFAKLLLAEPEAVLADLRTRLQAALGPDASLLLPAIPEMAALVGATGPPPDAAEARARAAGLAFLQTAVSPARPLVMVLEDLQWAPLIALRVIGDLLAADRLPGLLLVVSCRDAGAETPAPLLALLRRWQQGDPAQRCLKVGNLPPAALTELLAEMLRLPTAAAEPLAAAIGTRTAGNPCDTVELLNGLRRDRTLRRGAAGWEWDSDDVRRHVGQGELSDLLRARLLGLPAATQDMLANVACLGADVTPPLAAAAAGISPEALADLLSPALEDGVLAHHSPRLALAAYDPAPPPGAPGPPRGALPDPLAVPADATLQFRNKRLRELVYDGMEASVRQSRHLALARRLAPLAAYRTEAAEQYLATADAIAMPAERQCAATLFAAAAAHAAALFQYAAAARYDAAALALLHTLPATDRAELDRLRTARLTALYCLGRYADADQLFAELGPPDGDPLRFAEATAVQVVSLSNRGRHAESVAIGLAMLEHLGIDRPPETACALAAAVTTGLAALPVWLAADMAVQDADRPRTEDPTVRAAARVINRMLPSAQLLDPLTGGWLALQSQRLWATHGVCPEVVANLARSAAAPNVIGADYRTGYNMGRHAIAVGAALGYEPATSIARQNFATFAVHWFEPLEAGLAVTAAARVGLIRAGEIQPACINHIASLGALFDAGPTLEGFAAELASARDFASRTGNEHLFETFHNHQLSLQATRGQLDIGACLAAAPNAALHSKPLGRFGFHATRIIIAALFDDPAALAHHSAAALPLLDLVGGAYRTVAVRTLRALSLAQDARAAAAAGGGSARCPELDATRDWLAARAADAPANFRHLQLLIDAEIAWTRHDPAAAVAAFDQALQCCALQSRPWHHALIAERAGLFHLAQGHDYVGRALLRDAQQRYAAWGAPAVAARLTATHGFLDAIDAGHTLAAEQPGRALSSGAVDLLAVLRASHALSSQTTIGALHSSVVGTLAAMTGATAVRLVIWDEARAAWCLPAEADAPPELIEAAAARHALPLSAFRYVERTATPLLVDDAKLDDRFARDPYFSTLERCSLLVLPVQNQGVTRAVLLLENRLSRGVFSHARLDLVTLVASQLAVSLDNVGLYASLERRVAERTEALAEANRRLEQLSISDPLTGLANRRRFDDVLHSEWQRALRGSRSIGLVMVDIDHFKRYNDHYGHLGGDRCLRAIAGVLQQSVRQDVDLVARYGGEEFGLILPGADREIAEQVAGRAHAAVLTLQEPHEAAPLGHITLSAGCASVIPDPQTSADHLIGLADAALYRAKQAGRNQVAG